MIVDLAATFVKLCHVLCNFSAIVIFEVAAWLQALLDRGLRRFGTSKMHLSPPPRWLRLLSVLRRWFCCCWLFCLLLLPLWESVIVLCFVVRCFVSVLVLQSSWWGKELVTLLNLSSWCLVMVERLFLAVPQVCLRFVIVVFPDHTHCTILHIKDGSWKDYSTSLHVWRKYFAVMSYMSSKVYTFDLFQCLVSQMRFAIW